MKWKRPSGSLIETLDDEVTVAQCKAAGWKPIEGTKKVVLYRRLKGEIMEGQPRPPKVIVEREPFPEELAKLAIEDGWFLTEEEAVDAPADKAIVGPNDNPNSEK